MRKLVLAGLTVTALFAFGAVAIAQYQVPVLAATGKITPAKGGTKKKPKNALVNAVFTVNRESNSTLRRIEYTIPNNVKLNGTGFKTCSEATIGGSGESACNPKARVGTGAATAFLGSGPNASKLEFSVNVYVAGKQSLVLALKNSLVGTVPIPATISGQTVSFDIPTRVQNPTGGPNGPFSYVTSVTANLGKQPGISASVKTGKGKKRKTRYFASLRGCTGGVHTGAVKAFLANNPNPPAAPGFLQGSFTSACKKK